MAERLTPPHVISTRYSEDGKTITRFYSDGQYSTQTQFTKEVLQPDGAVMLTTITSPEVFSEGQRSYE